MFKCKKKRGLKLWFQSAAKCRLQQRQQQRYGLIRIVMVRQVVVVCLFICQFIILVVYIKSETVR